MTHLSEDMRKTREKIIHLLQANQADPDEHTITTVENPAAIVAAVEEPVQPEKVPVVRNPPVSFVSGRPFFVL